MLIEHNQNQVTIDKNQFGGLREKMIGIPYDAEANPPVAHDSWTEADAEITFDPKRHLNYQPASKRYTMEELGLNDGTELSPIGATVPFKLFTDEAVRIMKHEALNQEAWKKYAVSSTINRCMIRGYARDYAPFTYAAWSHPETVKAVSQEAGIDLQVVMDYDLASVNFAAQDFETVDTKPVISWHYDSYPFVCVTMLSETEGLVGGETVFNNRRTGEMMRISDPAKGSGAVLQGKYIEHQALKPQSGAERITMVTSFVPKNRLLEDRTVMGTTAPISNCNELFQEWVTYRAKTLRDRFTNLAHELEQARAQASKSSSDYKFNFEQVNQYLKQQQEYLELTCSEMKDNLGYLR